ncbi:MAG: biotin--[acetyl-CoA-carboxylase] ligase [Bacteroidales bacterium]|nr:biotin--[acetyl-CoA-carboxylase] ligase [Bacteroidales bacterium]
MKNAWAIKWVDELDSTNSELLRHIQGYDNLSVIAARRQTAGRGQRGNTWLSEPGSNLTFSILLKPDNLDVKDYMSITFLAASAVRDFLVDEGVAAQVKWPNDIYVGKRKICGMLIENGLEGGRIAHSVIGIGLNLNQVCFPESLLNPTSMKLQTGREFEPEETLEKLLSYFDVHALTRAEELRLSYLHGLFQKDIPCRYRDVASGEEFTGIIRDVLSDGRLAMETAGSAKLFSFKELSYIL